ncbi:MAG: hypothetical protein JXA93_14120 [Anaerolineae bacterium]|nr:hypothetical protein [Anaerolineae bacterium]
MEENQEVRAAIGPSSNERLWAALSWIPVTPLWPILAIVALILDDTKESEFVRYHAILSIATGLVLIPVSIVTIGCGALLYFVFFYWAYLAYQGRDVNVPFVSDWIRQWGLV